MYGVREGSPVEVYGQSGGYGRIYVYIVIILYIRLMTPWSVNHRPIHYLLYIIDYTLSEGSDLSECKEEQLFAGEVDCR